MIILGLNLGYAATASIIVNGKVIACVSEERFSRKKNDESYPKNAIEYCMKSAGLKSADQIDKVAIGSEMHDLWHRLTHYYSSFSIADKVKEQHQYWKPVLQEGKQIAWHKLYADRIDLKQYPGNWEKIINKLGDEYYINEEGQGHLREFIRDTIVGHIEIKREKIEFLDHHNCHAAYAYFASPFRSGKTLVITIDAFGDGTSASLSIAENDKIERFKTISHKDFQLARLYRYMTLLLGMKPDEHEYKVMGLAPYAKPEICKRPYEVFKETMYVDGLDFKFKERPKDMYFHFKDRLEGCRFDGIAGGLQKYSEELISTWVKNAVAATGIKRLVFAGGVSMNIKAMMEVALLPEVENIFIPPSAGDESLGLGAAYFVSCRDEKKAPLPLENAYLGQTIEQDEVQTLLKKIRTENPKLKITENASMELVAKNLASGRVLGRCAGRMEFGARSLGNRSILADPRSAKTIRVINEKIKNRDFWMPFAPAMLQDQAHTLVKNPKKIDAPYMTLAFETFPETQEQISAAIHPSDFTARPQFVNEERNPGFTKLLRAFQKETGVPSLLNTSFNLHGEPIVCTAADAYRVFCLTDIDDLLVGDALISKA